MALLKSALWLRLQKQLSQTNIEQFQQICLQSSQTFHSSVPEIANLWHIVDSKATICVWDQIY